MGPGPTSGGAGAAYQAETARSGIEAHARVLPRTARSKSQNVLARVQGPLVSVVSMNYMLQIIGQWEKDYLRNY